MVGIRHRGRADCTTRIVRGSRKRGRNALAPAEGAAGR